MDLGNAFGKVLKEHRKRAGLTQEELAFRANMHPTAISFYERGMRQPTLYSVFVIAEVLAIKASALVAELEGVQAPASGFDELSQVKSGAAESDQE